MSTQEITSMNKVQELSISSKKDQYTVWQVFGIWLAGSAPRRLLNWVAYPALRAGLTLVEAACCA